MAVSKGDFPDERAQHLLRVLVDKYIREGQPVGSRTLSRDSGLDLSPATIRNIMADLEEMGFVSSPHTSAGRVPTIKGYRLFVDTLIKLSPPRDDELASFREKLQEVSGEDPQSLATSVSTLLSMLTQLAGIVTVPRRAHSSLRQIEFLPLSGRRVLAILVVNEREVHNKILHVHRDFTEDELRQAGNYLTEQFGGRDLHQVRVDLVKQLEQTRESMNALMVEAIELAQQAFPEESSQTGYVLSGETNLLIEELGDMEKLKSLFNAFSKQHDMLRLLDQSLNAEGVQIFIGQESGYQILEQCSIVAAPYTTEDDTMGVLGVIGPTRMAYERVIPIVDLTSKLLGRALKSGN
jgi:heat-inducible transcriptional repressor